MTSIKMPSISSKTILQIDINQQKWEIRLANGKRSQQTCPKDSFLVLYFSIFSSTRSSFLLKLLHYTAMQMTIVCILRTKILILRLTDLGMIFQLYQNGFIKKYMILNPDKM